jgi:hypothetical protein
VNGFSRNEAPYAIPRIATESPVYPDMNSDWRFGRTKALASAARINFFGHDDIG